MAALPSLENGVVPLRVLLVDDHPDTRSLFGRLLRIHGYAVESAGSVGEALQKAERASGTAEPIELLISDLHLPDGSGLDLVRQLQCRYNLRAISVSGCADEDDEREAIAAGFERHIARPIDVDDLLAVVQEMAD